MSFPPNTNNPASQPWPAGTALPSAPSEAEALRQELEKTRQELEAAKADIRRIASEKINTNLLLEVSEYKRVMELERLGKQVLEMNTMPGSTLEATVSYYLKGIENMHKGMYCSCMRLEGNQLYTLAAPSLPRSFSEGLNGLFIGERVGSCGTAAYLGQKVIVTNIVTDPLWKDHYSNILNYGMQACWSFPLVGTNQKVLGTVAVYYQEEKAPTPEEEETLESIRRLLQLILENKLAEQELRLSNERYYYATLATNDAIWEVDIAARKLYWGIGFEKLFGFKIDEFGPELSEWAKYVHPEDVDRVQTSLEEMMTKAPTDFWREEYRFRKANGEYAHVADQGSLIRDEQGRPVKMVGAVQDITAQKQVTEKLHKLSVVARETINGVVIMNPDLTIQWVNAAFTRMTGYTLEEVRGKLPSSFMSGPATNPETLQFIRGKLKAMEPLETELIQYTKAGEKFWLKLQIQPLLDKEGRGESVFAMLTDITRQKEEEQRQQVLVSVITNTLDGIVISETTHGNPLEFKTIFFNTAFFKMTGYTQEEVMGRDLRFLIGPGTDPQAIERLQDRMAQHQPHEVEVKTFRKDGSWFWTQLLVMPIFNHREELTHWVSMMRDITARKHYEQEREVLISELTQNNADLKQFTFITSHNLRSPLANLTGIANLIDLNALPEGRNKLLIQKFMEATAQMNTVINDLLEILVIRNNPHSNKEEVDLQKAFDQVVMSVGAMLEETDVELEADFSEVPQVYFNASYLHSILLNLLTNAIKYRSPNRKLRIQVKTQKKDGKEVLYFSDNGLGIDLNRYGERIFGLYQRFHQHKDSKGMGLYIAHSQAKAMGGNLSVTSEVDKGSTFILEF